MGIWMQGASFTLEKLFRGKLLLFRKNVRSLWFSATNKGFNWKNANCALRKGRLGDVFKQNTEHIQALRNTFCDLSNTACQESLKWLAALSVLVESVCTNAAGPLLKRFQNCFCSGCNGWRPVAYLYGTVLTVTGDSAALTWLEKWS